MDLSKYAKYFNATYTDDVYLFQPGSELIDATGDVIPNWLTPVHAMGNVQAYSGDIAFKEYGMKASCEKRIFLPPAATVSEGWGVAFTADATEPELYVKWAPENKTHRFILAGTR